MSKKSKVFNQSAEPPREATSASAAAWRDGEVEQNLTNASHQSESSPQGTPPSNTVPNNCNSEHFKRKRSARPSNHR